MDQAAALARERNELLHAFFFQGARTTRRRDAEGAVRPLALDPAELDAITARAGDLLRVIADLAVDIERARPTES